MIFNKAPFPTPTAITEKNQCKILALREASANLFVQIMQLQSQSDRIKNSHINFKHKLTNSNKSMSSAKQDFDIACEDLYYLHQDNRELTKQVKMMQQRLKYFQSQKNDYNFKWDLQKSRFLLMKPQIEIDSQLEQQQDLDLVLGKPCKFYPFLEQTHSPQYSFQKSEEGFSISLRHNYHKYIKLCSKMSYPSKGRYYNKFIVQSISNNELILGITNHFNSQYHPKKKQLYLNFSSSFLQYNGTYMQPFISFLHPSSVIQLTIDMNSKTLICIIDNQQRIFTKIPQFNFQLESIYLFMALRNTQTALSFSNVIC